jgi:hypothetical protein
MSNCNHCDVKLDKDNWRSMGYARPSYSCRPCERKEANIRKTAAREFVANYKVECGCEMCGYNKSHTALDLAHIERGTKTTTQGRSAYNQNWSIKRIKQEFTKCRVLCANCHRVETAIENGWRI